MLTATVPFFCVDAVITAISKLFYVTNLVFLNHGCGFDSIMTDEGCLVTMHVPRTVFNVYELSHYMRFRFISKDLYEIIRNSHKTSFISFLYEIPEKGNEEFKLMIVLKSESGDVSSHYIRLMEDPRHYGTNDEDQITTNLRNQCWSALQAPSHASYWFSISKFRQTLMNCKSMVDRMNPPAIEIKHDAQDPLRWEVRLSKHNSFEEHSFSIPMDKAIQTDMQYAHFVQAAKGYFWPICNLSKELSTKVWRATYNTRCAVPYISFEVCLDWNIKFQMTFIDSKHVDEIRANCPTPDRTIAFTRRRVHSFHSSSESSLSDTSGDTKMSNGGASV